MSTSQNPPTKSTRRTTRKNKHLISSNGATSDQFISDNDSATFQSSNSINDQQQHSLTEESRPRRKSHANKKLADHSDMVQPDRSGAQGYQSEKTKATPIKQAYAGPTFHQSPAASQLPIPSFYSKSVPNVSSTNESNESTDTNTNLENHARMEHNATQEQQQERRESTPLDFLFDAARQARGGTPRAESPLTKSRNPSLAAGSPISRSPAPREGGTLFPFELDGGLTSEEDGTAFATPYKDRIEALQSTRTSSNSPKSLDEQERRAKADALKQFLLTSHVQQSLPVAGSADFDTSNPFNARQPQARSQSETHKPVTRHRSGPSTPGSTQNFPTVNGQPQYFSTVPPGASYYTSPNKGLPSGLRNVYGPGGDPEPAELSSDNAASPQRISTARKSTPQQQLPAGNHIQNSQTAIPNHRPVPSAQQMEDDLRRMLKIDIIGRG